MALVIVWLVAIMRSILHRIAGLMFLAIVATVLLLVYLANYQMDRQFGEYLTLQHGQRMGEHGMMQGQGMGMGRHLPEVIGHAEQNFIESYHRSLLWVGAAILVVGLVGSYFVARSITVPLRRLSRGVDAVAAGRYGEQVAATANDEVGHLANAFNAMSHSLADNQRLRRRLLADIAHELRTPLTIIQGNLEGMLEGVVARDDVQLASLHEEAAQLGRLITDLRDLSLAEAGQLVLDLRPLDAAQLIGRAVGMLQPLAEEKQIRLLEDCATSLPPLHGDAGRLNQVLYNLLTNALRYSPPGGTVTVCAALVEDGAQTLLEIAVHDEGPGVAAADQPYVFEHFYRADQARERQSGGSGLGLAIARRLVEGHRGTIGVDSRPGEGSRFWLRLPLSEQS